MRDSYERDAPGCRLRVNVVDHPEFGHVEIVIEPFAD
jgi:hypothetical protein